MSQYMNDKIEWIESYIKRCDEAVQHRDLDQADSLIDEILCVFTPELPQMAGYLSTGSDIQSKIDNLKMLKAQLKNYIFNLRSGVQKHLYADNGIHIEQTTTQNVDNSVSISVTQTADIINHLSDSILSQEEKDLLNGKLLSIETSSDKDTKWEKAKGALTWIADKSVEVGIAALPYIVQALTK